MVTIYVTLIVKGYKTFDDVPTSLQQAVAAELAALDLNTDGTPIEQVV